MTEVSRRNIEFELRAVILRHVAAGAISAHEAETAATAALPIVANAVKAMRANSRSVEEITQVFADRAAQAANPAARFAAELAGAIWTGMQADYRETYGREIGA